MIVKSQTRVIHGTLEMWGARFFTSQVPSFIYVIVYTYIYIYVDIMLCIRVYIRTPISAQTDRREVLALALEQWEQCHLETGFAKLKGLFKKFLVLL